MPEVPIQAFNFSGGPVAPNGWHFKPRRVQPTSFDFNTGKRSYIPKESYVPEAAASWITRSPHIGPSLPISASGVMGTPEPTNPSHIITLRFGNTVFEDVNDNDLTGFILGSDSYYRTDAGYWQFNYPYPPTCAIAEIVKNPVGSLEFYAVAQSRRYPFNLGSSAPSAENPIIKFLFDFGGETQITTDITLAQTLGGYEYYRGGPVTLTDFPEGDFLVRIRAMDSFGAVSNWAYVTVVAQETNSRFGSFVDNTNVLYSAVNDGDNVVFSRFKNGMDSREIISTIEGARNPSLDYDRRTNHYTITYEDRETKEQYIAHSTDGGVTWQ